MPLFFDFLVVLEKSLHTIYVLQNNRELAITSATSAILRQIGSFNIIFVKREEIKMIKRCVECKTEKDYPKYFGVLSSMWWKA